MRPGFVGVFLVMGVMISGAGGLVLATPNLVRLAGRDDSVRSADVRPPGAAPARSAARAPEPPASDPPLPTPSGSPTPPARDLPRAGARDRDRAAPAPATAGAEADAPKPAAAAAPPPDTLAEETQLLASALRALRRDRNPSAALAFLDQHRARFPSGALAAEATVARIDALLALGRRRAALEVLEELSLTGYSRRRELLVLRGELQTESGDCADALVDLDLCARVPAGDEVEERAIYGKAVCLARLGQRAEASTVLQGYLRRFPRGRFVKPALESLLDEHP